MLRQHLVVTRVLADSTQVQRHVREASLTASRAERVVHETIATESERLTRGRLTVSGFDFGDGRHLLIAVDLLTGMAETAVMIELRPGRAP